MFPSQTSLIPITIAITRFLEVNGLNSFFGNYPYWYLGVPTRFLSGPVMPLILFIVHKLVPTVSLFSITIYFVLLSFLVGAVGWGILVYKIKNLKIKVKNDKSKCKIISSLVAILLLILPWRYLSALALSEASIILAKNLLPLALLAFWNYLTDKNVKTTIISLITISLLLLINSSILPILVVGISALVLAKAFNKGKVRKLEKYLKPSLLILIAGLLVPTFWYGPSYWYVILTNPSIGGAPGFKAILRVIDLLRYGAPLFLAVIAVYSSGKIKSRISVFTLTWTFTFLFLTIFRFIGDPDFWQDWTAWLFELEIGVALVASQLIVTLKRAKNSQFSILNFQLFDRRILLIAILILIPFLTTNYVYGLLHKPKLISKTIPEGVRSLEKLAEVAGNKRVFLSGSTVFWANALYDLNQVRGGHDQVATHPFWDHAAFQLREGSSPELAGAWLKTLGVQYVLVHSPLSLEAYHDFKNVDKWKEVGEIVWEEQGDIVMKIPGASMAWIVDLKKLDQVRSPKNGVDLKSLKSYLDAQKRKIKTIWLDSNKVLLEFGNLRMNEGVILAVSYDPRWKTDENILLKKDPLGNVLLYPKDLIKTSIELHYNK